MTHSPPPLCFIGSSSEGLKYAHALAYHLDRANLSLEEWDLSTFALGKTTIEALEESMARCSFAALIATGDDKTISRTKAKISPRDNVVYEAGLFAGRLGRERVFLVVANNVPSLKLPSDLLGLTVGEFTPGASLSERRAGMTAVADEIVERIENLGPVDVPTDPALANELLGSVSRQLTQLAAGATTRLQPARRDEWVQSVLTAALDPFLVRTDDAYAVWLVPGDAERLEVAASSNLPLDYEHYAWARAQGLVGRVWDTGTSAATSSLAQHEWYESRPNCENESYVCAASGGAASPSGVLAIGSDKGFPIHQGDEGLVRAYAAILSIVEPHQEDDEDDPALLEQITKAALRPLGFLRDRL